MSLEEARRLLERSRELRWRFPSSSGSPVLAEQDAWAEQRGHVEIHRGNIDAAERYFTECEELGASDDEFGAAMTHLNRAVLAFARGEDDRARALLGDAESLLVETDLDQAPDDRFELDWLRGQLAEASKAQGVP